MKRSDLDKRICDVEQGATNTQTYREFMDQYSQEFYGVVMDLDSMTDTELNNLLEHLDYLCGK